MITPHMNWVAIMVSAFVAFVGGAIWYSPVLFAKRWSELVGMTAESAQSGGMAIAMIIQAVQAVVAAAVIAVVVSWSGADNPLEGAGVGALLGGGIVALDQVKLLVFERRSPVLFAINNGFTLLAFILIGAIEGMWR